MPVYKTLTFSMTYIHKIVENECNSVAEYVTEKLTLPGEFDSSPGLKKFESQFSLLTVILPILLPTYPVFSLTNLCCKRVLFLLQFASLKYCFIDAHRHVQVGKGE